MSDEVLMTDYIVWKEIDEAADDLVESELVTQDRIAIARQKQKENPEISLCSILIDAGFLEKEDLVTFLGEHLDVPVVDPLKEKIPETIIEAIPAHLANLHTLLPVKIKDDNLLVVMADPSDQTAIDELQATYPGSMEIAIGLDENITKAIKKFYPSRDINTHCTTDVIVENYETDDERIESVEIDGDDVINIVNNLMSMAIAEKASDIHLDPISVGLKVRFRIDGTLHEIQTLDKTLQLPVVSRVKIMAQLDISEKRLPQDGRCRIRVGKKTIDLRVATYPTMWGEKASMRVLTKDLDLSFDSLGLSSDNQKAFENIINQPHGMFLVTGPTGSGKTTTLYSAFLKINRMDKNAISIEDPIENEILGVNQAQVNVKAGVTFATTLRSMLRHDPDIILVGEIRDGETADITARAAMTGHLVFSTLHTNSAIGAITRLTDLGLAPYLIGSSTIGIMAQRLVRKVCTHCKQEYKPTNEEKAIAKDSVKKFCHGKGCDHCRHTGYLGRTGVYELITVDAELRRMIGDGVGESEMLNNIRKTGFVTMWEDSLDKVNKGITSITEVFRVCRQ